MPVLIDLGIVIFRLLSFSFNLQSPEVFTGASYVSGGTHKTSYPASRRLTAGELRILF